MLSDEEIAEESGHRIRRRDRLGPDRAGQQGGRQDNISVIIVDVLHGANDT